METIMKTAGIIAEYNPFHKGHAYHIEQTRNITGADYVIGIMSGDFVQRGTPAIIDKYQRTISALSCGCDLVLELPCIYSTSSAEFFASGAVLLLDSLGICDFLSFGSEKGSLTELSAIAEILAEEPDAYQTLLKSELKKGSSYPKARQDALFAYCETASNCQFYNNFWNCLKEPNNILALEYLKALKKWDCNMVPITVSRKNTSYHDKKLYEEISSATAIRHWLSSQKKKDPQSSLEPLSYTVPSASYEVLERAYKADTMLDLDDLTPYLHTALLQNIASDDYFHTAPSRNASNEICPHTASSRNTFNRKILDLDEELFNRLKKLPWTGLSFLEIADQLKSRKFTSTRIQRGLLHLILSLREEDFMNQFQKNPAPYVKILGFRKQSTPLLKAIKANSSIPVITKAANAKKLLPASASWAFQMDVQARLLYQSMVFQKSGHKLPGVFSCSPVILDDAI